MEAALLALFVQMIDSGATFASEALRRKRTKENLRLYEALKSLDANTIAEKLGPLTLASFMSGGVNAKNVQLMLVQPEFKALTRELFLVCLTEDEAAEAVSTVCSSIALLSETTLSAHASREDARAFGEALSERLAQLSRSAFQELDRADPMLAQQFQQTAVLKRMSSMLDLVSAHHQALVRLTDAESAATRTKFIENYRRACAERHGYITPPDFETNRKIPMEQLYVAPSIHRLHGERRDQAIQLDRFIGDVDRSVVLGDPGGGKSTLSGFIASKLARDNDAAIPFHVTLRYFAPRSDEMSLLEFIEHEMKPRYQLAPVSGLVEDLLLTGKAVVIFDGLDELIDATKRREVTRSVELFGMQYPHTPILVTSRRVGYEQAQLDRAVFDTYLIGGFEQEDVEKYVNNWFHSQDEFNEQESKEQAQAFVEQSTAVPDLRSNPLMLALMCIIFRGENYIPRNRPAVYEKCAMMLFEKWDGHRGIEVPLQARDHVDSAMKYIAYEYMTSDSGETGIPQKQVVDLLAEYLHPRAVESVESAQRAAKEFVEYCSGRAWVFTDAGATADGEPIFTFTHRTFMEYFAAVHLTRVTDTPEALASLLLPRVAREEWDVVAQLAVQQVDGTTDQGTSRVLTAMLNEKRRRSAANRGNVLTFIARCLTFAVIPPALVRQIASMCIAHFLDNLTDKRAKAMDPLETLRDRTSGLEAEYAASQIETDLNLAIQGGAQAPYALRVVLNWLYVDVMNHIFGEPTEPAWAELTVSLAQEHRSLLGSVEGSETILPLLLGWHGIISVEQTEHAIFGSSTDFCTRYFKAPVPEDEHVLLPSLAEWFVFATDGDNDTLSETHAALVQLVATGIVRDFWRGERHIPESVEDRRQLEPRRIFFLVPGKPGFSPKFADALVVLSFALLELHLVSEGRRFPASARETFARVWNDNSSGEYVGGDAAPASPEIAEFAAQWFAQKACVFDNLQSLQSSKDSHGVEAP